jgi:hypothetical protein
MTVGDSSRTTATVVREVAQCSSYEYDSWERESAFAWTSSDTLVATVDRAGWIRARAPGTALVHARAEGRESAPVRIVVSPRE